MMRRLQNRLRFAFTLTEVMVTSALAVVVGYTGYTILHVGLMLFAKNSAINVSHQQARSTLLRMENDFHGSISQVQLTNADGVLLPTSSGPEAGISFQVLQGGPFIVTGNTAKGGTTVTANFGTTLPKVGHRLLIPQHRVEADITAVSGSAPTFTVTLSQPVERTIRSTFTDASGVTVQANVQCFVAERIFYTVKSGRLMRHQSTKPTPRQLAAGIVSETPFRLVLGANGTYDRKMVTDVDLSTADPSTNNLGFKSANILLNATVPIRYRLAENL